MRFLSWSFCASREAAAGDEQGALGRHDLLNGRLVQTSGELRRHFDCGRPVALGLEPCLAAEILVELLRHDLHVGAGHRLVQADQEIALGDPVALLDPQLADDAAGRMLDLLDAGIDHELAAGDDGAGQGRGRRPQADGSAEESDDGEPGHGRPAHRRCVPGPYSGRLDDDGVH